MSPLPVSQSDTQKVHSSLFFKWSLILLVPIYTSADPYLDFTQANNSDNKKRKAGKR